MVLKSSKNYKKTLVKEINPVLSGKNRKQIIDTLFKLKNQKRYSHKINGKWENHYIDMVHIPKVKKIFNFACREGQNITNQSLVIPHKELGFNKNEFWFNIATTGESTGWHDHKENAVLSGVYYLQLPKNSGDIKFRKKIDNCWDEWSVLSQTGKMILFNSSLEHSVEVNKSNNIRVSLAFNLYTLPIKLDNNVDSYSFKKFYS